MRVEERSGALVVVDFNELEAYKIAMRIESDGIAFYEALAGRVSDGSARHAVLSLAREERDHLDFFRGELERIKGAKEDPFEEDDLATALDYGIFAPYRDLAAAVRDPRKALTLGVLVEERTAQFYAACRDRVSSEDAKRALDRILAEERAHALCLAGMRDAIPKA